MLYYYFCFGEPSILFCLFLWMSSFPPSTATVVLIVARTCLVWQSRMCNQINSIINCWGQKKRLGLHVLLLYEQIHHLLLSPILLFHCLLYAEAPVFSCHVISYSFPISLCYVSVSFSSLFFLENFGKKYHVFSRLFLFFYLN